VSGNYVSIQRAFLREDFPLVAALAQEFLKQYPQAPEGVRVSLWLALSFDRLQRGVEALQVMEGLKKRLATGHALWPEALYWEAEISRKAEDIGRAKRVYQQLLEQYPNTTWTPQAELALGMIYMQQQAYPSAITHFREVARRFPLSAQAVDAVLFEAYCYLQSRRFDDAVTLLIPYVHRQAQTRQAAQAAFYLGEALNGLKRYDEAMAAYRRAVNASQPSNWSTFGHFGVGWSSYQLGRCEESVQALATYRQLATTPEYQVEALFAEGHCLQQLGRSEDARTRFRDIVEAHATHALAFESSLVLADLEQQRGQVPSARALLEQWRGKASDDAAQARVDLQLAGVSLMEGDVAEARRLYEQVSGSSAPQLRAAALAGLGDLALFQGDLPGAQARYESAMRSSQEPGLTAHAQLQLGRLKLQNGRLDEAIALFRQVMASDQSSVADDARLALVVAYMTQREQGLARALLGHIRRQRPHSTVAARAAYYEALFVLEEGEEASARRLCQETLKHAASSEEALDARLLLAEMRSRERLGQSLRAQIEGWYETENLPRGQRAKLALRLGDQASRERDYAAALRWYDAAGRALPALQSEAAYRSASCFEEGQDYERALQWYQAIEQPPWQVRAQLAMAKVLERQNRIPEALKIYARMAKEPVPEAKVAKERYALLRAAQHE
jgi:tetratricopeptide (TPR) repeat protein